MTTMIVDSNTTIQNRTKPTAQPLPTFKVSVHIDTEVLDPEVARRKANVWLLLYAGHLLRADHPELIWEDETLFWRYDVLLTHVGAGVVGKIASIRVEAITGEVIADPDVRQEWITTARSLLRQKGLPVLDDDESTLQEEDEFS